MSVEEVERVLLYALESSVSPDEMKRSESLNLLKGLEENIENASPLFQLLLRYELNQQTVSMTIIRILESHLMTKSNNNNNEFGAVASPIASQLRTAFLNDFLQKIILTSKTTQPIKQFLKNSICKFLLTAFVCERLAGSWPEALASLVALLRETPVGRELLLKFCLILTEEIANSNVTNVGQSEAMNKRNAELRDSMRLGDNSLLCEFWRQVLKEFTEKKSTLNSVDNGNSAVMALECLAAFSSWIDVGLVVEGETLKLIYFLLQSPNENVQLAAADCLSEIVLKGMRAGDKVALANYMNLTSVFEAVGTQRGVIDVFFGKICRVLSNLGYSLAQQIHLNPQAVVLQENDEAEGRASVYLTVQDQVVQYTCLVLLPHLLQFLRLLTRQPKNQKQGNEQWQESMSALLPFISSVFEVARGMKENLRTDQVEFIGMFLPLCVDLLEFCDEEVEIESENANEEVSGFAEIRVTLFLAFESVLWLQGHATLAYLNSLTKIEPLGLGRCELLGQLTLRAPEGMKGHPSFTISVNGISQMTPIAELVTWVTEKIPERYPQLLFLIAEIIVRYSSTSYLDIFPERIDYGLGVLMRLLESREFREVDGDLLLRFVRNLKGKLSGYSEGLLTALQGPLSSARLLPASLYEISGLGVGALDPRTVQMDVITRSLLQKALDISMRLEDLEAAKIALNCLGAFAKGFLSDSCLDPSAVRAWFSEFSKGFLLERVLLVKSNQTHRPSYLNSLIAFSQRMIPLIQGDSIALVRELAFTVISYREIENKISRPIGEISAIELTGQLLPLLSASLFKLREQFACAEVLGQIWPILLPRLQELMSQSIQGTDDLLQHVSLCRAVLNLFQALSTSPAGVNFSLAQRNPLVESILMGIGEISFNESVSNADVISLLRSLCGILNRTQSHLSREFLNCHMIPMLLCRGFPEIFRGLDPSSRKSVQSLPAAFVNLIQDFLTMLRSLHQNGNGAVEWMNWNGTDLVSGDLKDAKNFMVNYFLIRGG